MIRAAETARIVGEFNNIPMKVEPRLVEQNFGKWEIVKYEDIFF